MPVNVLCFCVICPPLGLLSRCPYGLGVVPDVGYFPRACGRVAMRLNAVLTLSEEQCSAAPRELPTAHASAIRQCVDVHAVVTGIHRLGALGECL